MGSGLLAALAMFVSRQRCRLVYGLLELAFGVFVLWDAAGKGRGDFNNDYNNNDFSKFQLTVVLLQTFGAIYVIIRGLDHSYQGWTAIFTPASATQTPARPPSPPHLST